MPYQAASHQSPYLGSNVLFGQDKNKLRVWASLVLSCYLNQDFTHAFLVLAAFNGV